MQKLLIISDNISYFIFYNKIYRVISCMTKHIRFHCNDDCYNGYGERADIIDDLNAFSDDAWKVIGLKSP